MIDCWHEPDIHVFHAHYYVVMFVQKGAVEGYDVVRLASMHNLKFAHDSFSQLFVRLDVNDLGNSQACVILMGIYCRRGIVSLPCVPWWCLWACT